MMEVIPVAQANTDSEFGTIPLHDALVGLPQDKHHAALGSTCDLHKSTSPFAEAQKANHQSERPETIWRPKSFRLSSAALIDCLLQL